jgi:hypothetical protein
MVSGRCRSPSPGLARVVQMTRSVCTFHHVVIGDAALMITLHCAQPALWLVLLAPDHRRKLEPGSSACAAGRSGWC